MNKLQSLKAFLMYREAVLEAEKAHKESGERFYVLPCDGKKVFLVVADRKNIRILQRKHYLGRMKMDDVKKCAFYYTADRSGSGLPEDESLKLRQFVYQTWYEKKLLERKDRRRRAIKDWFAFVWNYFKGLINFRVR